jgi:hypothetical protein
VKAGCAGPRSHTLKATTWAKRKAGDKVNIEVDQMARYVARLMEAGGTAGEARWQSKRRSGANDANKEAAQRRPPLSLG